MQQRPENLKIKDTLLPPYESWPCAFCSVSMRAGLQNYMKLRKRHDQSAVRTQKRNGRDLRNANLGWRRNMEWSIGDARFCRSHRYWSSRWAVTVTKSLVRTNRSPAEMAWLFRHNASSRPNSKENPSGSALAQQPGLNSSLLLFEPTRAKQLSIEQANCKVGWDKKLKGGEGGSAKSTLKLQSGIFNDWEPTINTRRSLKITVNECEYSEGNHHKTRKIAMASYK